MNILVVNPANKPFTNTSILAEPIDVLQIATIIDNKFGNVKVIDMDVNKMDNNINEYLDDNNIVVFVYDYQLPLHTTDAVENILETVHNVNKPTKFIIIGKTPSYFYQRFLDNGIDVVIRGIAEDIINDVIENIDNICLLKRVPNLILKDDNKIYFTEKKKLNNNFNSLPIPNRDLVDITKYMNTRTMITSRGCNGICKFCTTPFYFGGFSG